MARWPASTKSTAASSTITNRRFQAEGPEAEERSLTKRFIELAPLPERRAGEAC